MNKNKIIEISKKYYKNFEENIQWIDYELRWMFNSELLMIVSIINKLNINLVIESWRARWHSTNILAKNLPSKKIISIDFDESSNDIKYSEEKLKKYSNLELLYGDSNIVIPENITKECAIIIDWPKWEDALILTETLLKNPLVKCVFIHDFHKNSFERNIFDMIFKNTFCSDDLDYVENFRKLDTDCWEKLEKHWERPYIRWNIKIDSYASTIAVVFNDENVTNKTIYNNFINYYKHKNKISLWKFLSTKLNNDWIIYKVLLKIKNLIK